MFTNFRNLLCCTLFLDFGSLHHKPLTLSIVMPLLQFRASLCLKFRD